MIRRLTISLIILLLIVGCEETLEPNPNPCFPDLVCGQAETCCDGRLYPTTCCDANCDDEIGFCETTNP
jgi:hypothetical protein